MITLKIGPILSFRGCSDGLWKVTALIGIKGNLPIPEMILEGQSITNPVILLEHDGYVYLRYDLSCKQQKNDRKVYYQIKGNNKIWSFTVPALKAQLRIAHVSCNGFSEQSPYNAEDKNRAWADLLHNHDKTLRPQSYDLDKEQLWHEERVHNHNYQRFHIMIMGGDQLYADSIFKLDKLDKWTKLPLDQRLEYPVSVPLEKAIADKYFSLYSERWGNAQGNALDAAHAMASIPTIMMWDDHDIFDGWGSYSWKMQCCSVFKTLFRHARRAFWVFQMQHEIDLLPDLELCTTSDCQRKEFPIFSPIPWQTQLQTDKLALPLLDQQSGFSFAHIIGKINLLVTDLRTERAYEQVLSEQTWSAIKSWLFNNQQPCQHLLFISSIPVIHPELPFDIDPFLSQTDNIHNNHADDIHDQWTHPEHTSERKQLLGILFDVAKARKMNITIVSGDVHVAAWGVANWQYPKPNQIGAKIYQLTSTPILHSPPIQNMKEKIFIYTLNQLAKQKQLINPNIQAKMLPFPNCSNTNTYILPRRNWLALEWDKGHADYPKLWQHGDVKIRKTLPVMLDQ